MAAVTDLELPRFEYLDPELRGDRFHETMRELRERSWIASSEFGYFVLDREAAGFFLRSRSATFPGVQMFELLGITEGRCAMRCRTTSWCSAASSMRACGSSCIRTSRPRRPTGTGLRCASFSPTCGSTRGPRAL